MTSLGARSAVLDARTPSTLSTAVALYAAPRRWHASMYAKWVASVGMWKRTRSLGLTPWRSRRSLAAAATAPRSSRLVTLSLAPSTPAFGSSSSGSVVRAQSSPRPSRTCRSTALNAALVLAPANHRK